MGAIELWGGVECTVNRISDRYFDQIRQSKHWDRLSDLDLFASLNIRKLRYPVLWEHVSPVNPREQNWAWADERLNRLRALQIDPIVGLIHHGSGPIYTSLLDPGFAAGLAGHARAVAERYPWVEHYTPVNEPLTTARFSGLYGHWYPHAQEDVLFLRMLLNQIKATKLAMQAIREVAPGAKLVQTEDMGQAHSSPAMAYQAAFENERRWLTFDLLCGRVGRHHPMWEYFRWSGLAEDEILPFTENPLPPDILGINYYITSERFLDDNLYHYPPHCHGSNRWHRYADVEAVRVAGAQLAGIDRLLSESGQRYKLPVAVTEAHLSCTREEQMRWFKEIWDKTAAVKAKAETDVRAVTAWALLGSYNWNSLLTEDSGYYENGVFDLRAPAPRPTVMVPMLRSLASGGKYCHPLLETKGWWHRHERYAYQCLPDGRGAAHVPPKGTKPNTDARPVLITGATGTLGQAFQIICLQRGISYKLLNRAEMDIALPKSVEAAIKKYKPWAIVNTAGYVRVDEAEGDSDRCYRENTDGPAALAQACFREGARLLTYSSDLVFDGEKQTPYITPYIESDAPAPMNVYGSSKAQAEQQVLSILPEALIVRTSAFFGPWDEHNFVYHALRALSSGKPFAAASDIVISPTYVPDLVHASLDLLIDGEKGIWHLANEGSCTWAELAALAASVARIRNFTVEARPVASFNLPAVRPLYTALNSEKGYLLPTLEHALHRYMQNAVPYKEGIRKAKQEKMEPVSVARS